MKVIVTFFLLSISISCASQVNFFQTGAKWGYSTIETIEFPGAGHREWLEQYEIISDTLINTTSYKVLKNHVKYTVYPQLGGQPTWYYYDQMYYIRFDSLNNKVFMFNANFSETLLFDFGLIVGDTVPNTPQNYFVVDSIEATMLFSQPVTKFYYSIPGTWNNPSQYIIEGMGASNGLILIQPDYISVSARIVSNLICFQLINDVYPNGSTCDVFAGIDKNEISLQPFLFPNTFTNSFKLFLENSDKGLLEIYDSMGRIVFRKEVINDEEISDLNLKGLMNARLIQYGQVRTCKIMHP